MGASRWRDMVVLLIIMMTAMSLALVMMSCDKKSPTSAEDDKKIATLRAWPGTAPEMDHFDFSQGKVITRNVESGPEVAQDLFYIYVSGEAFILGEAAGGTDLENIQLLDGYSRLEEVKVAPDTGYTAGSEVETGDIFAVITAEGNYAKIEIVDQDTLELEFEWEYQPNGSRNFP